jgi:hypothetical protein
MTYHVDGATQVQLAEEGLRTMLNDEAGAVQARHVKYFLRFAFSLSWISDATHFQAV